MARPKKWAHLIVAIGAGLTLSWLAYKFFHNSATLPDGSRLWLLDVNRGATNTFKSGSVLWRFGRLLPGWVMAHLRGPSEMTIATRPLMPDDLIVLFAHDHITTNALRAFLTNYSITIVDSAGIELAEAPVSFFTDDGPFLSVWRAPVPPKTGARLQFRVYRKSVTNKTAAAVFSITDPGLRKTD